MLLTGCSALAASPSPTSTYTDDSGKTVTVDWESYPAHAGQDGEALIEYPDQSILEPAARQLMDELRTTIADTSGFELKPAQPESEWFSDGSWHPQVGNGYGGDSLLTTVNCCELTSDGLPDPDQWQMVLDAASEITRVAGLGSFVRDESLEECADTDEQCWVWSATATDGVQWVCLSIQDRSLDPTGEASQEADKFDWPLTSIGISYGATVVQAGSLSDYRAAMRPFVGLDRPDATTSD